MTENGINGHRVLIRWQAICNDLEYEWNCTNGHILHYSHYTFHIFIQNLHEI